jgi:DNA-binding MarR family transcriptional regulator
MVAITGLLEKLASLIQQSLREDAARHGLLPIHVQILQYLASGNRQSAQPIAISGCFGVTRGNISQTLAVLERRGLVQREPDVGHRRRVGVRLTPAGSVTVAGSWTEPSTPACRNPPLTRRGSRTRCGLTGEPLAALKTARVCRQWTGLGAPAPSSRRS